MFDRVVVWFSFFLAYFGKSFWASASLFCLIALTFLISAVYVAFSFVQRDIFNALASRDSDLFYKVDLSPVSNSFVTWMSFRAS